MSLNDIQSLPVDLYMAILKVLEGDSLSENSYKTIYTEHRQNQFTEAIIVPRFDEPVSEIYFAYISSSGNSISFTYGEAEDFLQGKPVLGIKVFEGICSTSGGLEKWKLTTCKLPLSLIDSVSTIEIQVHQGVFLSVDLPAKNPPLSVSV